MYGKVLSACVHGIEAKIIQVEVDISNGLPQMNIVGLPDSAIRESIERIRAAIKNSGFVFPMKRITVNLAPADLRKEGSSFDLAIAVGILIASNQIMLENVNKILFIGEVALNGSLRPTPGVLPMVHQAKKDGLEFIILPQDNVQEAALITEIKICSLNHLTEISYIQKTNLINEINYYPNLINEQYPETTLEGYDDVKGQQQAKRALIISAAGLHNIMLIGPPGSGKTMLLRRLPTILTPMSDQEALEVTAIYSVAGKFTDRTHLIRNRPFRSPHHTISQGGMIGGGSIPRPGEICLAHRGVLFLDEFPEFSRFTLESMRQPLEDGEVTICRSKAVYTFPARFMLAASMNPCPCGYLGSETSTNRCSCSLHKIRHYHSKISGPLLDRIDLHVEVPRIEYGAFAEDVRPMSSRTMKEQVAAAQQIQLERYRMHGFSHNSELSGKLLRLYCSIPQEADTLLKRSFEALGLSIRAHDRILKIARTIADLEGMENITAAHVAEAIQYRCLDRKYMLV